MANDRLYIGADLTKDEELYERIAVLVKVLDTDTSKFLRSALREKAEKLEKIPEVSKKIKVQTGRSK
jgi:hypothetical protein